MKRTFATLTLLAAALFLVTATATVWATSPSVNLPIGETITSPQSVLGARIEVKMPCNSWFPPEGDTGDWRPPFPWFSTAGNRPEWFWGLDSMFRPDVTLVRNIKSLVLNIDGVIYKPYYIEGAGWVVIFSHDDYKVTEQKKDKKGNVVSSKEVPISYKPLRTGGHFGKWDITSKDEAHELAVLFHWNEKRDLSTGFHFYIGPNPANYDTFNNVMVHSYLSGFRENWPKQSQAAIARQQMNSGNQPSTSTMPKNDPPANNSPAKANTSNVAPPANTPPAATPPVNTAPAMAKPVGGTGEVMNFAPRAPEKERVIVEFTVKCPGTQDFQGLKLAMDALPDKDCPVTFIRGGEIIAYGQIQVVEVEAVKDGKKQKVQEYLLVVTDPFIVVKNGERFVNKGDQIEIGAHLPLKKEA